MAEDSGVRIFFTVLPRRVSGTDPNSPEALRVRTKADQILALAKERVGTLRYSGQHPERGRTLRESGSVIIGPNGVTRTVVFDHPAAVFLSKGTRPHSIGSKGQRLGNRHSPSRSGGGTFFALGPVNHPGGRANPFLELAAKEAGGTIQSGALKRGAEGPFPVVRAGSFA